MCQDFVQSRNGNLTPRYIHMYEHMLSDHRAGCGRMPERNRQVQHSISPDGHGLFDLGADIPPVRRVPVALARRFFQICTTVAAESIADGGLVPLEYAVMAYLN